MCDWHAKWCQRRPASLPPSADAWPITLTLIFDAPGGRTWRRPRLGNQLSHLLIPWNGEARFHPRRQQTLDGEVNAEGTISSEFLGPRPGAALQGSFTMPRLRHPRWLGYVALAAASCRVSEPCASIGAPAMAGTSASRTGTYRRITCPTPFFHLSHFSSLLFVIAE